MKFYLAFFILIPTVFARVPAEMVQSLCNAVSEGNPYRSCVRECRNSTTEDDALVCAQRFNRGGPTLSQFKLAFCGSDSSQDPEISVPACREACAEESPSLRMIISCMAAGRCSRAPENLKNECMTNCSGRGFPREAYECGSAYRYTYSWVENQQSRKLITSSRACRDQEICVGHVRYTDENANEHTILAVCGSEYCGNDDAAICARQAGYSSQSFEQYTQETNHTQARGNTSSTRVER